MLEIVGLGQACEIAARDLEENRRRFATLRDRLWSGLSREVEDLRRNGSAEAGLPNTLSIGIGGVEADTLLAEVGEKIAASAGAACHAAGVELSTVLEAMRVPMRYAMGTVRFSVGAARPSPRSTRPCASSPRRSGGSARRRARGRSRSERRR